MNMADGVRNPPMGDAVDDKAGLAAAVVAAGGNDAMRRYEAYLLGSGRSAKTNLAAWSASWRNSIGTIELPLAPQQVRSFIRVQSKGGRSGRALRPQSIERMLGYVSDLHAKILGVDDPTAHILVTSEMKALYRERGSRAKPIAPLRLKGDVADIIADDPLPNSIIYMLRALADERSGWALRARVVLGLGADAGRDRSDYVHLNVGDIADMGDGSGYARFGRPSSDMQIGEAPKFLSPDTMGFIREWLEWREKVAPGSAADDAPMLVRIDHKGMPGGRLSTWGYVDVLKDIMRRIGGGAHVSGNSFQAGLKLDLAAIGTTKVGIANALGFKELS